MSSSKRQSLVITGIGLILIAGIIIYFALSQPKIYIDEQTYVSKTAATEAEVNTGTSNDKQTEIITGSAAGSISYPVNLNTCTAEELMSIDGIGESRAGAIIEYREYIGSYTSVDEIKNIKGFGEAVYEKISPYLCV